jgi:hypothetical protein
MHALKSVPSQVRFFVLLTAVMVACTAIWSVPQLVLANDLAEATPAQEKLPPKQEELSLNRLQDLGILLRHIKHQAINIYWEASRTKLSPKDPTEIPDIRSIPFVVGGKAKDQNFLPARTQWLVYFFATIEPVARDLGKQVHDIHAGRSSVVIPLNLEKLLNPLCDSWVNETEELNKHLDEMVPLFDDAAHNNIKIQNLAVAIFQDAAAMEKIRTRIYKIVQGEEKKGTGSKIMITPALRLDQPLQQ